MARRAAVIDVPMPRSPSGGGSVRMIFCRSSYGTRPFASGSKSDQTSLNVSRSRSVARPGSSRPSLE
eukprot:4032452-Pleurochrysis_carterae.AAC.1